MGMVFVKCDYLDKFHLCAIQGYQDRWPISRMSHRYTDGHVAEAILQCIPESIKLGNLFLRWIALSPDDRNSLDERFLRRSGFPFERNDLYIPLRKAFIYWDRLQTMNGAPGFQSGLYSFTCSKLLNEELDNLIARIDNFIDQIESS